MSESTQKCPSCSETVPLEYSVCPFCGFGLLEYELKKFSFKPSFKEVFIRMYNFFRHPFRTSEEIAIATEKKGGNIILLLYAVFLALRYYMVMIKSGVTFSVIFEFGPGLDPMKSGEWIISISTGLILFLVIFFIMPFVIWIMLKMFIFISTWLMSKFGAMLGSEATTKQFRSIIGYSLAPIAAGEFLGIFFTLMAPSGGLGGSVTYSEFADYIYFINFGGGSVPLWIFKGLMIILWLIMIIYASISLRVIGRMAWVNAFVTIAVPIALFVFFFYFAGVIG
ncbi:MAG: hypothetical protein HeimAB125_04350 [Candidatus Heimdallarchaeota archaeon AB_125]|nr:MAG: hypothetical protein HeimAB125_04350 [Candidatus Heimdallarchaeota archaeon AB_125]